MRVVINLKPTVMEAPTKAALEQKIRDRFGLHYAFSSNGNGMVQGERGRDDVAFGVNYEKHRRTKKLMPVELKKGKKTEIRYELANVPAHWVAYVYVIPKFLRREQGTRSFKIVETQSAGGYTVRVPKKRKQAKPV